MYVIFIRWISEIDVVPTMTLEIFYPDNYTGNIAKIIVFYPSTNILQRFENDSPPTHPFELNESKQYHTYQVQRYARLAKLTG